MAKTSHEPALPRLLVVELWGLGDLALAIPFLQAATTQATVTLLAKPQAGPLLQRFAPAIEHLPLSAPWTAFAGKYRLHRWPWQELRRTCHQLRARQFGFGVSARLDPRDHALLRLANVRQRIGFPLLGSGRLLHQPLPTPASPHRAAHWAAIARALRWELPPPCPRPRNGRSVVIHPGAGHPARIWPRDRFGLLATRLRAAGWEVNVLDDHSASLDRLIATLDRADRFIGNDSGPGHLAAALGVPTFTLFGPQLPERFSPQHPQADWLEGAPCRHRPCHDTCRLASPYCLLDHSADLVWSRVTNWLDRLESHPASTCPSLVP